MKIALAHKRLDNRGGTEADFYRTATGLRDLGHEVHLFCASSPWIRRLGLTRISYPSRRLVALPDCGALPRALPR